MPTHPLTLPEREEIRDGVEPTRPGNAPRARTATACSAAGSQKTPTCHTSPPVTYATSSTA